jgi:phosphatidylglycerol lysyltransferase
MRDAVALANAERVRFSLLGILRDATAAGHRLMATLAGLGRRFPATAIIFGVLVAMAIARVVGRALHHGGHPASWAVGYGPVVQQHQAWRMLMAPTVTTNIAQLLVVLVLAVLVLPLAESRLGHRRAALAWLGTGVLGPSLAVALQSLGVALHENSARAAEHTVEAVPFAGIIGVLVLTAAVDRSVWLRRTSTLLLAVCTVLLLYTANPMLLAYLFSGLIGGGIGMLGRRAARPALSRGTHRVVRVRLAFLVAAAAVGPIITMTRPCRAAPLAPVGELFLSFEPGASQNTAVLLDLAPLALLLVAAWGLLRGSRAAALVVICAGSVAGLLAFWSFGVLPLSQGDFDWSDTANIETSLSYLVVGLIYAGIAVAVAVNLRHFALTARTADVLRIGAVAALGVAAAAAGIGAYAIAVGTDPVVAVNTLFLHVLPPAVVEDLEITVPGGPAAFGAALDAVGVGLWTMLLIAVRCVIAAVGARDGR